MLVGDIDQAKFMDHYGIAKLAEELEMLTSHIFSIKDAMAFSQAGSIRDSRPSL